MLLRSGDTISVACNSAPQSISLKLSDPYVIVQPLDMKNGLSVGQAFGVPLNFSTLEKVHQRVLDSLGSYTFQGLTYGGSIIKTEDLIPKIKNGDAIGAIFLRRTENVKVEKMAGGDGVKEGRDGKQEESLQTKGQLAMVMMELWENSRKTPSSENLRQLVELAKNPKNQTIIRNSGAIPILLNILRSEDSPSLTLIQTYSLRCLSSISSDILNCEEIQKCDGISILIELISRNDRSVKIDALYCLKQTSKLPNIKLFLRNSKFIELLISQILIDNERIQCLVLDSLVVLCFNDQHGQRLVRDLKGILSVVQLTASSKALVQLHAFRALGALATNNRKIKEVIRKSKCIERIIPLLSFANDELKIATVCSLAAICDDDQKNQNVAIKETIVPVLHSLLSSTNLMLVEQSCAFVHAFTKNNRKVQDAIREANLIPILILLLKSKSEAVIVNITAAV